MNALIILLFSMKGLAACMPASSQQFTLPKNKILSLDQAVEKTANLFSERYQTILKKRFKRDLVINLLPLDLKLNAEIIKSEKEFVISIYGGMLTHPKMNPNVMNLLLCHEIGHILGGEPLRSNKGWSSTEGQADYFSTYYCAQELRLTVKEFYQAAIDLVTIYAEATNDTPPVSDQMDESEVSSINYGYPRAQCRYDTLVSGWNKDIRPRCWFVE